LGDISHSPPFMTLDNTYSTIWKVSIPIILSGVAQNIVNVTDTIFLGRVSEVDLGAAGNAGIMYFVLALTGMGFTTGSQILVGRRNGENKLTSVGPIIDQTLYFMFVYGLLILAFFKWLSPLFLESIVNSPAILSASKEFIDVRAYGIIPAFLNFTFIAFFVGITRTRVLTYSMLIMSGVNVVFDYVLIFGNYGFPEMGIQGAALASVIAESVTCVYFIIYIVFSSKNYPKVYHLFNLPKVDMLKIRHLFSVSWPIMIQNFMSISSWFVFFIIIEQMGENELTVSHIIRSIYMVLMIPLFGFSNATNTLVSNYIGAGRHTEVLALIKKIVILSLMCTFLALVANLFFPHKIIALYTNNPIIQSATYDTLQVINFSMFFFCTAFIVFNGVTGTGNTKVSLLIESINITIYLSSAFLIVHLFNPSIDQVWYSEFIYFSFLGGMSWWYLRSGKWKRLKI
jgi:putative MATE family efflux protein